MESNLAKCLRLLDEKYASRPNLFQSESDLNDLSRIVTKMGPDRFTEKSCNDTVSKAFDIAMSKMKLQEDKEVLKGLR
jgi:hypothetical protein